MAEPIPALDAAIRCAQEAYATFGQVGHLRTRALSDDCMKAQAALRSLATPTPEVIEAMARALFAPPNPIWDQLWDRRWEALHESGFAYTQWANDVQAGKQGYRHDAEVAHATLWSHILGEMK